MNLVRPLFLLCGTLSLWSCGTTPQTGTSSETQTELQILANNARWIDGSETKTPPSLAPSARKSATTGDGEPYSCPAYTSTTYEFPGKFTRSWVGPCLENSTTDNEIRMKSIKHGPNGTTTLEYLTTQRELLGGGHGHLSLRGGLELEIDTFQIGIDTSGLFLWEKFRFAQTCSFEYRVSQPLEEIFSDSSKPKSAPPDIHSPINCGGKRIGTVVWLGSTQRMQVFDLDGRQVLAQPIREVVFPEDSLGLQLLDLIPRSSTDSTPAGGHYRLRLLPDESIPDTVIVWARDTGNLGDYLTKGFSRAFPDGSFKADFGWKPYHPWHLILQGRSWEAISQTITPPGYVPPAARKETAF